MVSSVGVDVVISGKIFMFGSMSFIAKSAGCLGLVETCALGRIDHFGNIGFISGSCGELLLQGLLPSLAEERLANFINPWTPCMKTSGTVLLWIRHCYTDRHFFDSPWCCRQGHLDELLAEYILS